MRLRRLGGVMLVSVAACRERATVSVAPTVVAERAESTSAPIVPSDLAASSNALGLDLLRGLELASGRPARSNLAFSPASLTTVLVMAWLEPPARPQRR